MWSRNVSELTPLHWLMAVSIMPSMVMTPRALQPLPPRVNLDAM